MKKNFLTRLLDWLFGRTDENKELPSNATPKPLDNHTRGFTGSVNDELEADESSDVNK